MVNKKKYNQYVCWWKPRIRPAATHITVIIPVYNVTGFLEEAIYSAITQNYAHKEIIVVDDGSSAEPAAEIQRICNLFTGVILLREPHKGEAAARERGIQYSTAEFVLFLDADDVLCPGALRYLAGALQRHPGAVAVYGKLLSMNESGQLTGRPPRPQLTVSGNELLCGLLKGSVSLYNGAVCMRRAAVQKLAPDNHHLRLGADWVFWCHLALSGDIVAAGERIVLHCRNHEKSISFALLDDPSAIFEAREVVYTDPAFIRGVGKERLLALRKECFCAINLQLASMYAAQSDLQRAAIYFHKSDMHPSALGFGQG